MKSYYSIIVAILLFISCSKNNDGTSELDINHSAEFELTAGVNKLTMANLQVGDLFGLWCEN
ncbi:hypothetical protein SAMN05660313_02909 [Cellulophaga fucicola]|uniref:Uncharacterized protein n=1 Tax=Cellulophaga fucicola TaxID=76595 RepID=A0A1K1QSF2_9FLAO|nr:hypothetical protein SAMN05660313_02909 [Cellulophaga fucicola]